MKKKPSRILNSPNQLTPIEVDKVSGLKKFIVGWGYMYYQHLLLPNIPAVETNIFVVNGMPCILFYSFIYYSEKSVVDIFIIKICSF